MESNITQLINEVRLKVQEELRNEPQYRLSELRSMPSQDLLDILEISDDAIRNVLASRRAQKIQWCIELLSGSRLRYRESDTIVDMDIAIEHHGISKNKWKSLRANLRKGNIEDEELDKLLQFLTSEEIKKR